MNKKNSLLKCFYDLLQERFEKDTCKTERDIINTFSAALVKSDYCQQSEILSEYKHPNINGAKVDMYIQPSNGQSNLVIECKYDREIPSGHNSPRPQKASKVFNDLFRLALFNNEKNVIKWFIYVTDNEMIHYFNNLENQLQDFFNLEENNLLRIDNAYIQNKCDTFQNEIFMYEIPYINIICVFQRDLPRNHKIKIFEVNEHD